VGEGSLDTHLRRLANDLGIQHHVEFKGSAYDFHEVSACYATCAAAVSGGYAGLQITQSLGFGVPVILPTGEPHAPEIELAEPYCTLWFDRDSPDSLAAAIERLYADPMSASARETARAVVMDRYSAEAMAHGFENAINAVDGVTDVER